MTGRSVQELAQQLREWQHDLMPVTMALMREAADALEAGERAREALREVKNLASDPFASHAVALRACLLAAYDGLGLPTGIDEDAPERQDARAALERTHRVSPRRPFDADVTLAVDEAGEVSERSRLHHAPMVQERG